MSGMNLTEIGGEIAKRRQRLGWSRGRLAEEAGTSIPTVSSWEEGRRERLGILSDILAALGLELRVTRSRKIHDRHRRP